MSLRDEILEMDDLKREEITVPEWGKKRKVTIRELNGEERSQLYEICMVDGKFEASLMAPALVTLSIIDPETGEKVFTIEDREKLWKKNGKVVHRISEKAMRLSGLGEKDQEDAEKN